MPIIYQMLLLLTAFSLFSRCRFTFADAKMIRRRLSLISMIFSPLRPFLFLLRLQLPATLLMLSLRDIYDFSPLYLRHVIAFTPSAVADMFSLFIADYAMLMIRCRRCRRPVHSRLIRLMILPCRYLIAFARLLFRQRHFAMPFDDYDTHALITTPASRVMSLHTIVTFVFATFFSLFR